MTLTDRGDESGKLFVGGLSWETTQEKLREYFSHYGQVVDSVVMKNNATGNSRGFGFVTFADPACLSLVLEGGPHKLDGKVIDPKSCQPRGASRGGKTGGGGSGGGGFGGGGDSIPKLFLGGLSANVTEAEVRDAFSRFGKVRDINIMIDQEKRRSRGFGFLSFESEDAVHKACAEHYIDVSGKQVECKLAVPRELQGRRGRPPMYHQQQQQQQQSDSWELMPPPPNWQLPSAPAYMGGWGVTPMMPQAAAANQEGGYGESGYSAYSLSYPQFGVPSQPSYPTYDAQGQPTTASQGYAAAADPNGTYSQEIYGASKAYGNTAQASYGGGYASAQQGFDASSGAAAQGAKNFGQQGYHPYRR